MNIEDLMVGDWYYWEAEGKKYPYQVKPEDLVSGEIANFQPIPLTPEILEKNGFLDITGKKKVFRVKNLSSHVGLGISFYDSIPYIYLLDDSTGAWPGYRQYDLIKLMYVHQLQHTLKTFEIKKDIIL